MVFSLVVNHHCLLGLIPKDFVWRLRSARVGWWSRGVLYSHTNNWGTNFPMETLNPVSSRFCSTALLPSSYCLTFLHRRKHTAKSIWRLTLGKWGPISRNYSNLTPVVNKLAVKWEEKEKKFRIEQTHYVVKNSLFCFLFNTVSWEISCFPTAVLSLENCCLFF